MTAFHILDGPSAPNGTSVDGLVPSTPDGGHVFADPGLLCTVQSGRYSAVAGGEFQMCFSAYNGLVATGAFGDEMEAGTPAVFKLTYHNSAIGSTAFDQVEMDFFCDDPASNYIGMGITRYNPSGLIYAWCYTDTNPVTYPTSPGLLISDVASYACEITGDFGAGTWTFKVNGTTIGVLPVGVRPKVWNRDGGDTNALVVAGLGSTSFKTASGFELSGSLPGGAPPFWTSYRNCFEIDS